ncbi:hypothetical protein [Limibacillus halophilus]|uniref:Cell division protein FtsB n=1 Tax=Limibacillus halophilus TaxID=1579333 RepID=A0A839SSA4_9PROT|nr:hypothetical protein [Limibacillus halophilus]MBB3065352.1 cell division protein FtsB [Limibacillus halophilus]
MWMWLRILSCIAVCLTAVAAFAVAGYYYGRDSASSETKQLERELDVLKAAVNTEGLISFLSDLKTYNETLFQFGSLADQISQLEKENSKLEEEIKKLNYNVTNSQLKIKITLEENTALRNDIKLLKEKLLIKYTPDKIVKIDAGNSYTFMDGLLTVGVLNVFNGWANLKVKNEDVTLDVGEQFPFKENNLKCVITLSSVNAEYKNQNVEIFLLCKQE